jgi:uncharacterized protein YdiU (UPF0061 family)
MKKLEQEYLNLNKIMYSEIEPNQIEGQKVYYLNKQCALDFGFEDTFFQSEEAINLLVGNKSDMADQYIAQAYCGHQFGHFNVLGDGRAMLLGDFKVEDKTYDLQLKGSGRTPYSRGGDGLGTTSSMMRELLISEAMHRLGIPTTRSLVVMSTKNKVLREQVEEGAILARIASSHLRVGTFQFARMQDDKSLMKEIADFAIERHYPQLSNYDDKYRLLLRSVIINQANLIAKWQSLGFIHGVMNTDNMTISGETIDYGPCAFMNEYDQKTVYSQIDRHGRYAFANQPVIALWNLTRLAETMVILLDEDKDKAVDIAKEELSIFNQMYEEKWLSIMFDKIGVIEPNEEDKILLQELLDLMEANKSDYTNTFRLLSLHVTEDDNPLGSDFDLWIGKWKERLASQSVQLEDIKVLMQKTNPYIIPRNSWVEQILAADSEILVDQFLEAFSHPFDYSGRLDQHTYYEEARNYSTHCNT